MVIDGANLARLDERAHVEQLDGDGHARRLLCLAAGEVAAGRLATHPARLQQDTHRSCMCREAVHSRFSTPFSSSSWRDAYLFKSRLQARLL